MSHSPILAENVCMYEEDVNVYGEGKGLMKYLLFALP